MVAILANTGTASGTVSSIELWEIATGRQIQVLYNRLDSDNEFLKAVIFTLDGQSLIIIRTHAMMIMNIQNHQDIYLMAEVDLHQEEWLAWTPEGFFAGTNWATHNLLHIAAGRKLLSIDQAYNIYYRPDLIAAKAAGKDISSYSKELNLKNILQGSSGGLPPVVEILSPKSGSSEIRDARVQVRVTDQGGGVGRITIFNGDSPVILSEGGKGRGLKIVEDSFTGPGQVYEALLSLRSGVNTISASAYNRSNSIESTRVSVQLKYSSSKVEMPDLYILALAVTHYRDGSLQLKYPVDDAMALVAALQNQGGRFYRSVHVTTLYDDKGTRGDLLTAFDELATKVKPDDVFVLYFAGHGVTNDKDGDYYFLPADFRYIDSASIAQGGISKDDITRGVAEIAAQKSMLLFDTCDSGSFIQSPSSRGMAEKTAVDRLTHAVGRATIVASSKNEVALEGYRDHGVFTYALLEGLSGAADAQRRGYVSVKALSSYVENEVPDLTFKMAGYEQIPQSLMPVEDFPFVKD